MDAVVLIFVERVQAASPKGGWEVPGFSTLSLVVARKAHCRRDHLT